MGWFVKYCPNRFHSKFHNSIIAVGDKSKFNIQHSKLLKGWYVNNCPNH